jgi:hypothetical protein
MRLRAREGFGVRPVNVFTALLASIVVLAAVLGLAFTAMSSGWEPFADARVAFPWPYRQPADARLVGVALPTACAVAVVAATVILAYLRSHERGVHSARANRLSGNGPRMVGRAV